MFEKKKKIELNSEELRILRYSLIDFRNNLLKQNKYADPVDEILPKLKDKLKVDKYDLGLLINSLNESRTALLNDNKDTESIDYLLLKLIKIHDTL